MNRKVVFFLLLNVICVGFAFSQQITRIAVIDLPRVYTTFFRDSRAVREFEERATRVQNDIDRMTKEIQDLRSRHADAISRDDQSEMIRIEAQINRRTENLREFYQARMAELERQKSNLMQSDSFLRQVHDEIRFIAESEGYSAVFDLKNTPGIIWHSPSVDITDKVLQSLNTRSRN
ncbi:MAG: OmpH family outer membrane protein [Treponema sp.]|nr:OmpH family outer membrane protein [Treponema sp.]MCL2250354.1 OmpH family outer membrane protein [Treponema sp.]